MNEYKEVIRRLRDQHILHAHAKQVVTTRDLLEVEAITNHIQGRLAFDLTKAIDPVVRKSVSEDPRFGAKIYENDIFVITDPSAFFVQLHSELELAYKHGTENGKRYAERHGWDRADEVLVNQANNDTTD